MKKNMGDSGTFGPAMKNVPNSLFKRPKNKTNPNIAKQLTGKGSKSTLKSLMQKAFGGRYQ